MATPGKPLPAHERERIIRLRAMGLSIRRVAAEQMVSINTVQKYAKKTSCKVIRPTVDMTLDN